MNHSLRRTGRGGASREPSGRWTRRFRAGLAAAALATIAGCGTTEPSPLVGVQGTWALEFLANGQFCGGPPEFVSGCSGAGTVQFQPSGDFLVTSGTGRGACQGCSVVVDYTFGAVTATYDGRELAMQISTCRLTGALPTEADTSAQGEAVCQVPGTASPTARGTWRMTRRVTAQ